MCGLFGALHCGNTDSAERVAAVVAHLGKMSEERGRDASGLAIIRPNGESKATATRKDAAATFYADDSLTIVKDAKAFTDLLPAVEGHMGGEGVFYIGHTRWATQGDASAVVNASPLMAGHLVGTHNGDIDTASIPGGATHKKSAFGATDTEILYRALNRSRLDRRGVTAVLRTVKGRAALAFINRENTSRLYLARTALSPLSYAYDVDGNFYYASNPNWFRKVSEHTGVVFTDITLIPEGHLLTVNTTTGEVEDVRRFTPTCRESDLALINTAVYRNFDSDDKSADQRLHRHKVATRLPAWPSLTKVPVTRKQAGAATKSTAHAAKKPASTRDERKAAQQVALFSDRSAATLNDRLSWEEPDSWMYGDDPWATHDDPPAEYFDSLGDDFDLDEVEELCWDRGQFDMTTYVSIVEAEEDEARKMVADLRRRHAEGLVG